MKRIFTILLFIISLNAFSQPIPIEFGVQVGVMFNASDAVVNNADFNYEFLTVPIGFTISAIPLSFLSADIFYNRSVYGYYRVESNNNSESDSNAESMNYGFSIGLGTNQFRKVIFAVKGGYSVVEAVGEVEGVKYGNRSSSFFAGLSLKLSLSDHFLWNVIDIRAHVLNGDLTVFPETNDYLSGETRFIYRIGRLR